MVARLAVALALLPMAAAAGWSQQQGDLGLKESHTAIPLYRITFEEGEPVKGVGAAPAFRLPFHCSGDGTIFITTVQPLRPDAPPPKDPLQLNPLLLISISPSGEAHSFPLNQITDLYSLHQIGETPTDSKVVFLVSAAAEDKPEKDRDSDLSGSRRQLPKTGRSAMITSWCSTGKVITRRRFNWTPPSALLILALSRLAPFLPMVMTKWTAARSWPCSKTMAAF